jgi:O-antigen/teichoic acid export membrane protein
MQGLHFFKFIAVLSIIAALIKFGGSVFALVGFGGINSIISFILISGVIQIFFINLIIRKKVRAKLSKANEITAPASSVLKDRQLWYVAGVTSILALLNNFDIVFVKSNFSAQDSGIYSTWSLYAKILLYVIGPLLTLSFIFFTDKKNKSKHNQIFLGVLGGLIVAGAAMYTVYELLGSWIITAMFGPQFLGVVPYLKWASLFGIAYVMMMFMMNYFLARKSGVSLIPAVLFPIYVMLLFTLGKDLQTIIFINVGFTFFCVFLFFIAYFRVKV